MPVVAAADVTAIILGIVALIFLLAGPVMTKGLGAVFSKVPLVGNYIRVGIEEWWALAIYPINWFFKQMLGPVTSQIHLVAVGWQYIITAVGYSVRQVDLAADHIVNVVIPRVYNASTAYAAYLVNGLLAYVDGRITFVVSYADYLVNGLLAYVNAGLTGARNYAAYLANGLLAYLDSRFNFAVSYAASLVNGLLSYTNSWINTLRSDITNLKSYVDSKWDALWHTVEADIATAEQRAETLALEYAKQALIDAIGITDQAAVKALSDIWPHLATDLNALEHAIPAELTDIKDLILSIPRTVPASLVDALTALGALAVPLIRYLEDCGIPLCQNLHGLSDLVNSLESAAVDAALIALFAEMVTNPHDAADAILTVVAPIADASASATRSLIGV